MTRDPRQLELPHLDGTVERVRDWTVRVAVTRGPEGFCGVVYGVQVVHDGGGELVPGWRLCHMTLDEALDEARAWGRRLKVM